jgi:hypothetical protein
VKYIDLKSNKKMAKPPAYDIERIAYINSLMDGMHDSCNDIYENLIDRDFDNLQVDIDKLIYILKDIKESLEDDIT